MWKHIKWDRQHICVSMVNVQKTLLGCSKAYLCPYIALHIWSQHEKVNTTEILPHTVSSSSSSSKHSCFHTFASPKGGSNHILEITQEPQVRNNLEKIWSDYYSCFWDLRTFAVILTQGYFLVGSRKLKGYSEQYTHGVPITVMTVYLRCSISWFQICASRFLTLLVWLQVFKAFDPTLAWSWWFMESYTTVMYV